MSSYTPLLDWNELANGTVLKSDLIGRAIERAAADSNIPYTQDVRYFDFDGCGKTFTQVALILKPERPLRVNGRKVVLITSEGGSDNGIGFIRDNAGNPGLGPWAANRGITFIQLPRLGRWNFLTKDPLGLGSWADVPLDNRMPVFNRQQKKHWTAEDYITVPAEGISSPTESQSCRVPRENSELEEYMIALVPTTSMTGFEIAIRALVPAAERDDTLVLYNGFSTGGAFLWALSKQLPPDGIVGYGMSNFPIAYYWSKAATRNYSWLYDKSAARLRERGARDFKFFNRELPEAERAALWANALHHPRFKSHEDTFMFYNVAALSECVSRLWNSSFLPESVRSKGLSALMQANLDLCFPGPGLGTVRALDLYGTRDEVLKQEVVQSVTTNVGPHCAKYRMAYLDGYHHSIIADHVHAYASLWLDAIKSGYCQPA